MIRLIRIQHFFEQKVYTFEIVLIFLLFFLQNDTFCVIFDLLLCFNNEFIDFIFVLALIPCFVKPSQDTAIVALVTFGLSPGADLLDVAHVGVWVELNDQLLKF